MRAATSCLDDNILIYESDVGSFNFWHQNKGLDLGLAMEK